MQAVLAVPLFCPNLAGANETNVSCTRMRTCYTGHRDAQSVPVQGSGLAEVTLKLIALEADAPGADVGAITAALLQAEARRAWELVQAGVIRELYFRADRHAAVLVLECASPEEAHDVLATLPLVRAGLIIFEVIPLAPYPGFARLFESRDGSVDAPSAAPAGLSRPAPSVSV